MRKLTLLLASFCVACSMTVVQKTQDVSKEAARHIVKLTEPMGGGTGFYVNYKGKTFLVTNKHVCGESDVLHNGDTFVDVLAKYDKHDLCILESDRSFGLRISNTTLKPLDIVHVVGHPLLNELTVRDGRFVYRFFDKMDVDSDPVMILHVSVAVFGGNSGSPLLNEGGEVEGVVFATDERSFEDSFVVPKEDLIKFLEEQL